MIRAVLGALMLAGAAQAEPVTLRPDDTARLAALDAHFGTALREAFAGGAPADLATLGAAMAGTPLPPDQALAILPGDWSCQVIKIGGISPLVIYPPFRCTAGTDGRFDKITGSQRKTGKIKRDGDALIYTGTGYVEGDMPRPYAELPAMVAATDTPQLMPEVGVVEMTTPSQGRILFPAPYLESRFDVLVLMRP